MGLVISYPECPQCGKKMREEIVTDIKNRLIDANYICKCGLRANWYNLI